jgi:drug/metabolite transporter (DMT)-like permease
MILRLRINRLAALGYLLSLGAAACYGSTQVIARFLVTGHAPPIVVAAFSFVFGTIYLMAINHRELRRGVRIPGPALVHTLLAGVAAAIGVIGMYFALARAPVVLIAPIVSVNPMITLLLAHLFLQRLERITIRLILGAFLVVGGVVLVIVGSQ